MAFVLEKLEKNVCLNGLKYTSRFGVNRRKVAIFLHRKTMSTIMFSLSNAVDV